jgi:hypothetical protein
MFCYVYGDYFNLYTPGKLAAMGEGQIGIGAATDAVLVGVSALMAIPSLMIFLSLALPPTVCRWLNVFLGVAYSAVLAATMPGAAPFYIFLGVIEIALTLFITATALAWPREPAPQR